MAKNSRSSVNLLFTSAGRRVELLRAFRQAFRDLDLAGNVVALDIDPLAPALQVADRPYIVPRLTSPDFVPALLEICHRERISVIFPLIDPDIPLLAHHRGAIEATGARLAVAPSEAIAIARDKWQTARLFQSLGLPTPQSWLPESLDPSTASYPLFIKPRDGSAAKSTFRVNTPEELAFFTAYVPNAIVQEFLPGAEITTDVVCDLDGDVLAVVSRRRIEVRWGEVAKGVTVHDPFIIESCLRIAKALPAIGPFTVQAILREGTPYFTEINARLGGGVPLGIAAGVASPRWLLARVAGVPASIPPIGTYTTGLYLTRFDEAFYLTEGDLERMASHRL